MYTSALLFLFFLIFSQVSVSTFAYYALPSNGSLRFMAITNADNDQDQLAAVAQINPTTGSLSLHGNFSFAVTVVGVDCTTSFDPVRNVYYAITGNGPNIDTIDAVSGKILSTVETEVAYGITAVGYDPTTKSLKGIGGPVSGRTLQYIDINATSGVIKVLNDDLKLTWPIPCESALSVASQRYYTLSQTKQDDDADEVLLTIDVEKGTVISSIPWAGANKKLGIINSIIVIPSQSLSSNETIISWVIDHNFNHPPTLIWIDPISGLHKNLTSLPNKGTFKDSTVPLQASALLYIDPTTGNITIGSIIFDNAEDETYLAMVTIQPTGITMINDEKIYSTFTESDPVVTLDLVKVDAIGTQLLWAPAWVTPPADM